MFKKDLHIPFNAPLNSQDTELQTYGCRQNNPDICAYNTFQMFVHLHRLIVSAKKLLVHGRNKSKSSRFKPLNFRLRPN